MPLEVRSKFKEPWRRLAQNESVSLWFAGVVVYVQCVSRFFGSDCAARLFDVLTSGRSLHGDIFHRLSTEEKIVDI